MKRGVVGQDKKNVRKIEVDVGVDGRVKESAASLVKKEGINNEA